MSGRLSLYRQVLAVFRLHSRKSVTPYITGTNPTCGALSAAKMPTHRNSSRFLSSSSWQYLGYQSSQLRRCKPRQESRFGICAGR